MTDENDTSDDGSRTATWRVGPFSLAVIAVMVLADVVIVLNWRHSASQMKIFLFAGLFFGQAGAAAAWTFAEGVVHRLVVAAGSLVLGGVLGTFLWMLSPFEEPSSFLFLYVLLVLEHQVAVLVALLVIQLIKRKKSSSPWRPQFVVRQLLAIMVITALVATVIRSALKDIGNLANFTAVLLVISSSIITILAAVFLMNHRPTLRRLGLFAGLSLLTVVTARELFDITDHLYILVVQMATLTACLVVPQFDRHRSRSAEQSRDVSITEQHLDENA